MVYVKIHDHIVKIHIIVTIHVNADSLLTVVIPWLQEVRGADGGQPQLRLRRVQHDVLHSGKFVSPVKI